MVPAYNEIEETPEQLILWKNPDLPEAGKLPFKDVVIEWGQAGNIFKPMLKIKRILYPKPDYDRVVVEKIATSTENCPFCKEGRPLEQSPAIDLLKYIPSTTSPLPEKPTEDLSNIGSWIKQEWDDFWRLLF